MKSLFLELSKQRKAIHKGLYPYELLKKFGAKGLYANFYTDKEKGLYQAFENIASISSICTNTAFCVWSQIMLNYYVLHSQNQNKALFKQIAYGELLGGTGLSNALKALASLEKNKLQAQKTQKGYCVNGFLPWVSNINQDNVFVFIARTEKDLLMALAHCKNKALSLKEKINFIALKGSSTKTAIFRDYLIKTKDILHLNACEILPQILPGFILLQNALAAGLVENALKNIKKHIFYKELENIKEKQALFKQEAFELACKIYDKKSFKKALRLKIKFVNLALKAAQILMLESGARAYLKDSLESKIFLEAQFLAIISPSLSHIQRLLNAK